MTRLLLVCHEGVGEALSGIADVLLGRACDIGVLPVATRDDPDVVTEQLAHEIRHCCAGQPPLVLTDLPGATPHNFACMAVQRLCPAAPVVTGLNLAMLLKAVDHRARPAAELAELLVECGHRSIFEVSGGH